MQWNGVKVLVGVLLILVAIVTVRLFLLADQIKVQATTFTTRLEATRDSMAFLQRQVDSLKQQTPGLGEYMSAIQLHISKVWFAAKASNWGLASYELNELGEAIDGARLLHAIRDSVDVSGVLQSVSNSQIQMLKQTIQEKRLSAFVSAYNQTLAACNSCHRAAGYGFIHIITPASQPVTNQRWEMSTK